MSVIKKVPGPLVPVFEHRKCLMRFISTRCTISTRCASV